MAWNWNDTKTAHDVIDWVRLWGDRPVGFETWKMRLFPGTKQASAARTWLRLRQKLRRSRYQEWIEVSINPLSFCGEMEVAILNGAASSAEEALDKIERAEAAQIRRVTLARRRRQRRAELKRRERAAIRARAEARRKLKGQKRPGRKRKRSAVAV